MTKAKKEVKFSHRDRSSSGSQQLRRGSSNQMDGSSDQPPGSPLRKELMNGNSDPNAAKQEEQRKEYEKKKQSIITRTIWTFVMMAGFLVSLLAGHLYIILIVTAIQIISFKEVIAIADVPSRARSLRFTKTLNWYFLGTTMYYLYGESVVYYFKHIILVDKVLLPFATHHRFISFMLYVIGFVFFVTSLQKGVYKFQFTQFAWTHMALYLIVVQGHFIMNNVFEGMIWFLLPVVLVITNDIWAYICGMTFGRTPLIKLSPKKTVEGFVGAWVFTVLAGYLFTNLLSRYSYFICPVNDLGANFFTGLHCKPNNAFIPHTYDLSLLVPSGLPIPQSMTVKPIQFHVFVFSTFASLIAPFGGFFASGLKRTFNVKDFGDSIPGHGGMTDRMDCQFIMGFFAFMYYQSFIAVYQASVGGVIEMAIQGLTGDEQIEVMRGLTKHLVNQGLISAQVLESISSQLPLPKR